MLRKERFWNVVDIGFQLTLRLKTYLSFVKLEEAAAIALSSGYSKTTLSFSQSCSMLMVSKKRRLSQCIPISDNARVDPAGH